MKNSVLLHKLDVSDGKNGNNLFVNENLVRFEGEKIVLKSDTIVAQTGDF